MERTALITGGSRGIGFGIAEALAKQGYNLAINGRRQKEDVSAALDSLRRSNINAHYYQADIAVIQDHEPMLKAIEKDLGPVHVLINNAGMAPRERKDLLEMGPESYREVMSANLEGPFFLTQQLAKKMIRHKEENPDFPAMIINMGSISATVASVQRGEYCLSKAGMAMMTSLFAARLGEYDIPVYEIRPGVIATDMTKGVKEKYDTLIEEGLSLQKRWGLPSDIGKAVISVVSGHFPFSTGQVFMVDGGMTVARL